MVFYRGKQVGQGTFSSTTTVTGFEEIYKRLEELPANMQKNALRSGVPKVLKWLAPKVQSVTRQDTGDLQASISAGSARINRAKGTVEARMRGLFYARFLEHGTKKMTKKPFIEPTINANATAMLEQFKEIIDQAIAKQYKKLSKISK